MSSGSVSSGILSSMEPPRGRALEEDWENRPIMAGEQGLCVYHDGVLRGADGHGVEVRTGEMRGEDKMVLSL